MNAVSRNETRQKFKIVQNWHIGELHRNDNFFEIIQTFVSSVSLLENSLSLYTISLSLTVFLNLSILNSLFFLFYFSPSIFYSLHFTLSLFNSLFFSISRYFVPLSIPLYAYYGPTPSSFSLIFVFSNTHYKFYNI